MNVGIIYSLAHGSIRFDIHPWLLLRLSVSGEIMVFNTISVSTAIGPTVIGTYFSHVRSSELFSLLTD